MEANSGVRQVKSSPDELQELSVEKITVAKSGYIYVYTSNESQQDVYFDNLVMGVSSGPLLEETHYYPYGLTMTGVSTNALKGIMYPKNRTEYNGIEHTTDIDLNQYDAFYRTLDPQIGRWRQIDPQPDYSISLYAGMSNNPILNSDFAGDTIRGYSERSANRLLEGIRGSFAGHKNMQSLFQIGSDGKSLSRINVNAFIDASSGLNEDQLTLAGAYMLAINQDATHVVSVLKSGENVEPGTRELMGESTADMFDFYIGGGINVKYGENSTFSGIIMDSKTVAKWDYKKDGKYVPRSPSFGETIAHEVLSHGVGWSLGNPARYMEDAIQMTNVYLRSQEGTKSISRDGGQHGYGPLDTKVANDVPQYFKDTKQVLKLMKLLR